MQKFLAKYATAAHLAILTVAPLLLFPFFSETTCGIVLLWLSLPALIWLLLEPSRRKNEPLHIARMRNAYEILHDPLAWISFTLVVISSLRWLNSSIDFVYNAEVNMWLISKPLIPVFPTGAIGTGFPQFASVFALAIIIIGVRHSLGKKARLAFFSCTSIFAALTAIITIIAVSCNAENFLHLISCDTTSASYYGTSFGLYFLSSLIALLGTFEARWYKLVFIVAISAALCFIGLYFFSPLPTILLYLLAGIIILLISVVYGIFNISYVFPVKYIMILITSILIIALGLSTIAPQNLNDARLGFFLNEETTLFPNLFFETRAALSKLAQSLWMDNPWIGVGNGAFHLNLRFVATENDWSLLAPTQKVVLNGYWNLLVERGIIGSLSILAIIVAFLFTLGYRVFFAIKRKFFFPGASLGVIVLLVSAAEMLFDVSCLRTDYILAFGAFVCLSISSCPKKPERIEKLS